MPRNINDKIQKMSFSYRVETPNILLLKIRLKIQKKI